MGRSRGGKSRSRERATREKRSSRRDREKKRRLHRKEKKKLNLILNTKQKKEAAPAPRRRAAPPLLPPPPARPRLPRRPSSSSARALEEASDPCSRRGWPWSVFFLFFFSRVFFLFSSLLFFSGFFPSSLLFIKEKHLTISFSFLSPRKTRTTNTRAWDRAWPTAQSTPSSARGTPLPWRPRRQRRKWPPPRTSPAALGPSRSWPA